MSKIVAVEDNIPKKDNWLRVEWNLGRRCNHNCSYCGNDLHDNISEHMPWDVYTATIDKIIQGADGKDIRISFTGGEPFIHPEFVNMLKYAKDSGVYRCSVTTNGSPPLKIYERAVEYLDYIIFSYHFEYAKHERVIDNIIAVHKLVEEYNRLEELGEWIGFKDMHVHVMFLPGKLDECKEIMAIMDSHNIRYTIRRIRPRANYDRTGWLRPYEDGMLGWHPRYREGLEFEKQNPYYSDEERQWLKENA